MKPPPAKGNRPRNEATLLSRHRCTPNDAHRTNLVITIVPNPGPHGRDPELDDALDVRAESVDAGQHEVARSRQPDCHRAHQLHLGPAVVSAQSDGMVGINRVHRTVLIFSDGWDIGRQCAVGFREYLVASDTPELLGFALFAGSRHAVAAETRQVRGS